MPRLLLSCLGILAITSAFAAEPMPQKIVCLGDSITDGHTYPLLVRQALTEAGQPVPVIVNAGVGGDTAAGMRKRLERDVLSHKPNLVTLSVGINDVLRKVKVEDYEADVTAIAERLKAEKVPLLIMTTSILVGKHAEADARLADFNAALRRVAEKYGCKVAEVNKAMREAHDAGQQLLMPDDVHLNFDGYRVMTRALLDALGYPKVPVPAKQKLEPVPGLVRDWHFRPVGDKEGPLDDNSIRELRADSSWKDLSLPEKEPRTAWWEEQERQRGFSWSLPTLAGKAKGYVGLATLEADKAKDAFINPGAEVRTIWLNGKRVYRSEGFTGWHLGRERVPVKLAAGKNQLVIETGSVFSLSVTDTNDW
jgi:lysophospholipase L1-like esterase